MALPVVLAGLSSRGTCLPISLKLSGSFSFGSAGGAIALAATASSPNVAVWPPGALTTPSATAIESAATFHCAAAAWTNIARAAAAALRYCSHEFATELEPPVPCRPSDRFAYLVASAGANSATIWSQAASSSSAINVDKPVVTPWPLSRCLMMAVTLLSAPIFTNALNVTGPVGAAATGAFDVTDGDSPQPTMKPAPASVVTLMNVRRVVVKRAAA